jgi:hypothetical protein
MELPWYSEPLCTSINHVKLLQSYFEEFHRMLQNFAKLCSTSNTFGRCIPIVPTFGHTQHTPHAFMCHIYQAYQIRENKTIHVLGRIDMFSDVSVIYWNNRTSTFDILWLYTFSLTSFLIYFVIQILLYCLIPCLMSTSWLTSFLFKHIKPCIMYNEIQGKRPPTIVLAVES